VKLELKMPKIRDVLEKFKNQCKGHGWRTSEKDDWIQARSKYHNFVTVRNIHPSSFRIVAENSKCIVRDDLSYRVVEASYTAWLFSEAPPEALVKTVCEHPVLSKRIALYHLSPILDGESQGLTLNKTDSAIFREFERFLIEETKVQLKPFHKEKGRLRNPAIKGLA